MLTPSLMPYSISPAANLAVKWFFSYESSLLSSEEIPEYIKTNYGEEVYNELVEFIDNFTKNRVKLK